MKTNHTSEPWIIDEAALKNESGAIQITETDSDGQLIALVYGETIEAQRANARLIAAAPELLVQLQTALRHIENIQEKYKPEVKFAVGGYIAAIKKSIG
jgi:hypothetical protein